MIHEVRTIDAHAAGEPLRLITAGLPTPEGVTMLAKQEWVREHCDWLRRALLHEPRGHADMAGAMLTEPCDPEAVAGVLFMHNQGYSPMCGHGVIAVGTIALERRLIAVSGNPPVLTLDTPAGLVRARPRLTGPDETRVASVGVEHVPSFVLFPAVPVWLDDRTVPVDVAFGGAFYAIVDSEAAGLPLRRDAVGRLREAGMRIARAVEAAVQVVHPLERELGGIHGTIFTGLAEHPEAALRNATVFANAQVDRSPSGTGTAAVMAVLDAMGFLPPGQTFVHESLLGTLFTGRVRRREQVGERDAIVPEVEGAAWITGEHTFLVDDRDPLREGFLL